MFDGSKKKARKLDTKYNPQIINTSRLVPFFNKGRINSIDNIKFITNPNKIF